MQLPVLSSAEASNSCGSACGVAGRDTVDSACHENQAAELVEVPFENRRLELGASPDVGSFVRSIDLDITVECNLRCTYCFKEKWTEHMEERVAFDAMVWLLHASGPHRDLHVNFMGGEPLLRFKLIKKLVPFAKRRAAQLGKTIHFGMTTNGTLVTDDVIAFWKQWGMGFHTSIDGTPEVQDANRPTQSGRGSARLVEKSVPKILAYRPGVCARSTVTPETAGTLVDSYRYFRGLGYIDIAFVPGGPANWDDVSIAEFESQFQIVAKLVQEEFKLGNLIHLKGIGEWAAGEKRGRSPVSCGAGRSLLLVDIHGDIWPCHRWNKRSHATWRIGSIYEQFNEASRAVLDVKDQTALLEQDCDHCLANKMCSGGCPAENLEETGSVYRRHSNACKLTRAVARVAQSFHEEMVESENEVYVKEYC